MNMLPGSNTNRTEGRPFRASQAARRRRKFALAGRRAFALVPMAPMPGHEAAGSLPEAVRGAIGTLPLLAALGIGIAVAVIAVIAFLQMTSRGRNLSEQAETGERKESGSGRPDEELPEPANPNPKNAGAAAVSAGDDPGAGGAAADFTLPLSRIPAEPGGSDTGNGSGPRLCGVGGEFAGASFPVNGGGLRLGRDPEQCQVVFPAEVGEVSRSHCTVGFDASARTFLLEDHGSSNGTFLSDGERLEPGRQYELYPGDRFALSGGKHWFEVRI